MDLAKAMEGTLGAGTGADGPTGVGDVERLEGCCGTQEALLARDPTGVGSVSAYNP